MSSTTPSSYFFNRASCIVLVLCLLSTSTPAAPQTIVGMAQESSVSFLFWLRTNEITLKLQEIVAGQDPAPKAQEKQEDRDLRVSRIEIYPGNVTIAQGQKIIFTAAAYDTTRREPSPMDCSIRAKRTAPAVHCCCKRTR